MAWDYFKPRGRAKASKPDAGGAAIRSEPVFGVVKDNVDPIRAGRLQVYIADFGAPDPDDDSSWVTVEFMTPFFGQTEGSGGQTGYGSYLQNPSSYGMWFSPPDIGSTVVCMFINGDMNYGFYIGSVPSAEALTMVPAIGATDNVTLNSGEANSYGGATKLPVTNLNENNGDIADGAGFLTAPKPVHSYVASIYSQQGLIRDPIRGPITSSAQRESPSRVGWGVSTPGRPIYEGGFTDDTLVNNLDGNSQSLKVISRRGGHSIVMDDGDIIGKDQLIRLRTALGHQILMSDDGQCLHIIHSNGQAWIELGKEGTIDMYSMNSVNVRTQGDLNLHADNNININAKKDLNIAAENIKITSESAMAFRAGSTFSGYCQGAYSFKVGGGMSMAAGGEASYAGGGALYLNGSKVNLNTGSGTVPEIVSPIPIVAHTDTLFDKTKGFAAAPGKLLSITSRAPAHAPWSSAGQGVNVKVTNNASSELPAAPSAPVAEANKSTNTAPSNPTSSALAATVPVTNPISSALDKNVTGSMVSSVAADAAKTAASVVSTGAGSITDAAGKVTAAVGKLAQTPQQLETAGILKPGSGALVNSLVQGGSTVEKAMTSNLFTGAPGAENLVALTKNVSTQVEAQVTNFQKSQAALQQSGVITGNESAVSIAGLVTAGSQVGVKETVDFVKNVTGTVTAGISKVAGVASSVSDSITGAGNAVSSAMASGNFAANIATNVTGGLGSLTTSLSGITKSAAAGLAGAVDAAKGLAGSAFSAITAAMKPFKAGVPQNLKAIAEKNIKDQAAAEAAAAPVAAAIASPAKLPSVADITGAVNQGVAALGQVAPDVAGAVSQATGALTQTATNLSATVAKVASVSSSVASGINALPGGQAAVSSVVDAAKGAVSKLPGTAEVSSLIQNAGTAAKTGVSLSTSIASTTASLGAGNLSAAVAGVTDAVAGVAGSVTASVTGLKDKLTSAGSLLANGTSQLSSAINKGTQSLASLVSSGLPASKAAELNAAINALSSETGQQIKIPTVATNTVDRSELKSQISSVLGSLKIPVPNFSGPPTVGSTASQVALEEQGKTIAEINTLRDQRFVVSKAASDARYALSKAKQDLPQGDPAIATAEAAYTEAKQKLTDLDKQIVALQEKQYAAATKSA